MPFGGEAVGIDKMRVFAAEAGGFRIHFHGEIRDAPGEGDGQGIGGVASRGEEDTGQQVFHRDTVALFEAGCGSIFPEVGKGGPGDGNFLPERQLSPFDGFQGEQRGHHFGGGGGRAGIVFLLAVEQLAGRDFDQADGGRIGFGSGGKDREGGQQHERRQQAEGFFHNRLLFLSDFLRKKNRHGAALFFGRFLQRRKPTLR